MKEADASETIRSLRAIISGIDKTILSLLAVRMSLSKHIGYAKSSTGLPVYDPAREVEVLSIVQDEARRLGVPVELALAVYKVILDYSRCSQVVCPEKYRIVVYGYGRMAKTLAKHFLRGGCWVAITGRSVEKARSAAREVGAEALDEDEALDWADIMLYAIPSDAVPTVLESHLERVRESVLLADIASVKKPIVERVKGMLREGQEYVSLHPLFGPLECPAGETIAVVPVRLESWKERLERLLEGLGFRYEYVDADTHDRIMAANQVLHHAALDAFKRAWIKTIEELGVRKGMAKLLATHSLRHTLELLDRLERLWSVVEEIRRTNPNSRIALEKLEDAVRSIMLEVE